VEDDDKNLKNTDSNKCNEDQSTDADNEDDADKEEDGDNDVPAIARCIVFKCIGCTKEHCYQEVLINASEKHRKGEMFL